MKNLTLLLLIGVFGLGAQAQTASQIKADAVTLLGEEMAESLDVIIRMETGEVFPEKTIELCYICLGSVEGDIAEEGLLESLTFTGNSINQQLLIDTQILSEDTLWSFHVDGIPTSLTVPEIINGEKLRLSDVAESSWIKLDSIRKELRESFPDASLYISAIARYTEDGEVHVRRISLDNLFQVNTVSVPETQVTEVKIFPNPTTSTIQIDRLKSGSLMKIYNISGQVVQEERSITQSNFVVDVSNFSSGTYILWITNPDGTFQTGKFQKE